MAEKWVQCQGTSYNIQGGVIADNIRITGDYPNIKMTYDVCAQWWSESPYWYSIQYNGTVFKYWATTYGYYTVYDNPYFGRITGYSQKYAKTYFNEQFDDQGTISREVWLYVSNVNFPYETGACVVSGSIESPTNLKASIISGTSKDCKIEYSFTNMRKFWGVRVWDDYINNYVSNAVYSDSGTISLSLEENKKYKLSLWIVNRKGYDDNRNIGVQLGEFTTSSGASLYANINGSIKQCEVYMNINGAVKKIDKIYQNVNGIIKENV